MKCSRYSILAFGLAALPFCACGDNGTAPDEIPCAVQDAGPSCPDGRVCAGGWCVPCESAIQCETEYGSLFRCESGHCVVCTAGEIGCTCVSVDGEDECYAGNCVSGLCRDCVKGEMDCSCFDNGTCHSGLRCTDDGQQCEECPPGERQCVCGESDSCDDGLVCRQDVCVKDACRDGEEGCPCLEDDSCSLEDDPSLICSENGICVKCTPDIEKCPCDDNDACLDGLVCDDGNSLCRVAVDCADAACQPHQTCVQEAGFDAACVEGCVDGWVWNPSTLSCDAVATANCEAGAPGSILTQCEQANRVCEAGIGQIPAVCGECLGGYVPEVSPASGCRSVITCGELDCGLWNRDCQEALEHADALCGDCSPGYLPVGEDCVMQTCLPDDPSGIAEQCAATSRVCVQEDGAPASCGQCIEGYAENGSGACTRLVTCEELGCAELMRICVGELPMQSCGDCVQGTFPAPDDPSRCLERLDCDDIDCPEGEYCVQAATGDVPECVARPCLNMGEALRSDTGKCVTCYVNCSDGAAGVTGDIWPYTLSGSDRCICTTRNGFFWDEGENRGSRVCDADGDGWVRKTAQPYVESTDEALRTNARCPVRKIDRFVLQNEYGQRRTIQLCIGEQPYVPLDERICSAPNIISLYETVRNDDQSKLELDPYAPAYSLDGVGRRFRAGELNGLTRACTLTGDFNHNGVTDLIEWHGMPTGGLVGQEAVFLQFSYMVELHWGWFEARRDEMTTGQFVIAERSRCDQERFGPTYPANLPVDSYWRQCARGRDIDFGLNGSDFGFDFARWSCADQAGGCPIPPPPEDGTMGDFSIPTHGLCHLGPLQFDPECSDLESGYVCTDNTVWRGMSHHSQFRCVQLVNTPTTTKPAITQQQITDGEWIWNSCRATCPDSECNTFSESEGGASQPSIRCTADRKPNPGDVGIVAAGYGDELAAPPLLYTRGCLNECREWRSLCPGYSESGLRTMCVGEMHDFGRLSCGCSDDDIEGHYMAEGCDIFCPARNHLSSFSNHMPRNGTWMCIHPSSSTYSSATGLPYVSGAVKRSVGGSSSWSLYRLVGEIPTAAVGNVTSQEPGVTPRYRILPHGGAYLPAVIDGDGN